MYVSQPDRYGDWVFEYQWASAVSVYIQVGIVTGLATVTVLAVILGCAIASVPTEPPKVYRKLCLLKNTMGQSAWNRSQGPRRKIHAKINVIHHEQSANSRTDRDKSIARTSAVNSFCSYIVKLHIWNVKAREHWANKFPDYVAGDLRGCRTDGMAPFGSERWFKRKAAETNKTKTVVLREPAPGEEVEENFFVEDRH